MNLTILNIIFNSIIHILLVVFAEGILFFYILSEIEIKAIDNAIHDNLTKIINFDTIYEYKSLQKYPSTKATVDQIINTQALNEKQFINFHNQKSFNNFYKLVVGLIVSLILIYYYIRYYKNTSIEWLHIIGVAVTIFVFIAIFELTIIFNSVLKLSHNEDSILLNIISKLQQ
jgi:hypothetical protein